MNQVVKANLIITLPSGFTQEKEATKPHPYSFYEERIKKLMNGLRAEGAEFQLELVREDGVTLFLRTSEGFAREVARQNEEVTV